MIELSRLCGIFILNNTKSHRLKEKLFMKEVHVLFYHLPAHLAAIFATILYV